MDPITKAFEDAAKNPKMRKKMRMKVIFSTILFVAFLGVIFITIGTIMSAKGGQFLGHDHLWYLKLRANYGLIMMALIIIHLIMNWKLFSAEMKVFSKE